jgi:hypothetical protein
MITSIHQPNFIPWIGFFHKALSSDRVILFDSVQISSGKSYTTRVKILFQGKEHWLSMPVKKAGNFGQKICETELMDFPIHWRKNLGTIKQAYARAPFFKEVFPIFEELLKEEFTLLSELNRKIIQEICNKIGGQKIEFHKSSETPALMTSESKQTDYILETCLAFKVTNYLSGRGSSFSFLEQDKFKEAKIQLNFQDFKHPVYAQLGTETFVPGMSILDLLMNKGYGQSAELLKNSGGMTAAF